MSIRAILLDIEGTVSPIAFVRQTLFPYAKERFVAFLDARWSDPEVAPLIDEIKADQGWTGPFGPGEVAAVLSDWSDEDRKAPPLKAIQGMIWEEGYRDGSLKAPLFDDAATALRRWHRAEVPQHIYSSGSVEAQKLFFGHTDAGNMLPLLSGHFDTRTGPKIEAASYTTIAAAIGLPPEAILFLSDNERELVAAAEAGLKVAGVLRPGNALIAPGRFPVVESLLALPPDLSPAA